MTTSPEDPPRSAFVRSEPIPDQVVLEYDAVLAAELLQEADAAYLQAAAAAEHLVENQPAGATAEGILAAWRDSNTARREIMRTVHERGQNLVSAINTMLALD